MVKRSEIQGPVLFKMSGEEVMILIAKNTKNIGHCSRRYDYLIIENHQSRLTNESRRVRRWTGGWKLVDQRGVREWRVLAQRTRAAR